MCALGKRTDYARPIRGIEKEKDSHRRDYPLCDNFWRKDKKDSFFHQCAAIEKVQEYTAATSNGNGRNKGKERSDQENGGAHKKFSCH